MKKKEIHNGKGKGQNLTEFTRWGSWEQDVLSLVDDPADIQRLVKQRQRAMDDDESEAKLVEAYFHERISRHCDADVAVIFLPNPTTQVWLEEASNEHLVTNKASTKLEILGIQQLSLVKRKDQNGKSHRGWLWRGLQAPKNIKMKFFPFPEPTVKRR